jgi:hypothetical protein
VRETKRAAAHLRRVVQHEHKRAARRVTERRGDVPPVADAKLGHERDPKLGARGREPRVAVVAGRRGRAEVREHEEAVKVERAQRADCERERVDDALDRQLAARARAKRADRRRAAAAAAAERAVAAAGRGRRRRRGLVRHDGCVHIVARALRVAIGRDGGVPGGGRITRETPFF